MAMLAAEAAWLSGWDGDTGFLVDAMRTQQGRVSVISHATITLGPVDRTLGLLALAEGRTDEARVPALWCDLPCKDSLPDRSRPGGRPP